MKTVKRCVVFGMFCAVLACCGDQHKAESVVGDFIDANIALDRYSVKFSSLDSTDRVTPERIMTMRKNASTDHLFKRNASFLPVPASGKYLFTRTKIINGTDTVERTFYMDDALTGVIAFK